MAQGISANKQQSLSLHDIHLLTVHLTPEEDQRPELWLKLRLTIHMECGG